MTVILGVDGGGTNTRASIVSDGRVVAHGHSGSIKRLRVGAEAAEANLRALLKDVFAQAGVSGALAGSVIPISVSHSRSRLLAESSRPGISWPVIFGGR